MLYTVIYADGISRSFVQIKSNLVFQLLQLVTIVVYMQVPQPQILAKGPAVHPQQSPAGAWTIQAHERVAYDALFYQTTEKVGGKFAGDSHVNFFATHL